jgi:hypothetical protein
MNLENENSRKKEQGRHIGEFKEFEIWSRGDIILGCCMSHVGSLCNSFACVGNIFVNIL